MTWSEIDAKIGGIRKQLASNAVQLRHQCKSGGFQFKPFSDKQKQLLTWWCDESPVKDRNGVIADGAIRSGKTLVLSLSFVLWAMYRFNGQSFALCGKTIGSLRRNLVFWLKAMLLSRGYQVQDRRADNLLLVRRGAVLNYFYLFGGKDERSQDLIQGITLAGALFDEVALMPESFVNQATARCSVDGSKWWFSDNPEGPQHWFLKEWICKRRKKQLLYLHFTMEDNLSLSEPIKARYRSQYTGVFYERYILGRWVVAEGLVYQMFSPALHVVTTLPRCCTHPDEAVGRYFLSIDYGTQNPFSAGLWCISGGVATRVAEYYYDGRNTNAPRTDEEHYTAIEALCERMATRYDGVCERAPYLLECIVIDPSAASMIECIRRHGRFLVRAAKNDVVPGISTTASLLSAGKLNIHASCQSCIAEFGMYRWDEKAKCDAVLKENDHAMDDVRYFCYTILRKEFRWGNWDVSKISGTE